MDGLTGEWRVIRDFDPLHNCVSEWHIDIIEIERLEVYTLKCSYNLSRHTSRELEEFLSIGIWVITTENLSFAIVVDNDYESFSITSFHLVAFSDARNIRFVNDHARTKTGEFYKPRYSS